MKQNYRFWSLVTALAMPLSCSSEEQPPGLAEAGTSGSASRSGSPSAEAGGEGAVGAGGRATGGAADGPPIGEVGGDGFYVGEGGAPENPATACRRDAEWVTTGVEAINTAADERLLAMTPDERTLVYSQDDALFVRDDDEVTAVALPPGYTHALGVSVTADGLALIIVAEDGSRFAEVSRASRGSPFSEAASTARFTLLNNGQVTSGDFFSSPALSVSGESFYYTARKGPSVAYVYRAHGEQLSQQEMQDPVTLGTEDGQAKLVVSVSSDERTLFVLDEALGYVTGLWSATPAAELTEAIPLPELQTAVTNLACDRIYGTTEIDGSLDVVVGTRK